MQSGDRGNQRVLVVDDQKEIHNDFAEMLQPLYVESTSNDLVTAFIPKDEETWLPEFELLYAPSGEEACEIIKAGKESNCPINVAYVDIRMPSGIDGVETIRRVRKIDRDVEIVIMTAYSDHAMPEIIRNMELLHKLLFIKKPFAREEIQQITISLVEKWNVERELAEKQWQLAASRQKLRAVLDAVEDPMAMYDDVGRLIFANQGYEKIYGIAESALMKAPPEELVARIKKRFRELYPSEQEEDFFKNGGNVVEEITSGQASGQRMFFRSTHPVFDGRGGFLGDLYVYHDLSGEIEARQMKAEVLRLRTELETTYSFANLVGNSTRMQRVYSLVKRAAESDITVLIRGESGTGKELVARSLHFNGLRKKGPFLAINCAAIPEALIESELFGHEQGAFTGATKQKIGTFEYASGGTILLDEIGDMSPVLQAKLLRILQDRKIRRVGGTTSIPVDVRVIVATNKNLETAISEGEFREDLYYRITAFPIIIPPLRERREDIPLLAKHFLEKHREKTDKSISGFSTAALELLLQYDWPGNVRELENAIERAILLETEKVLQADNLPLPFLPVVASRRGPLASKTTLSLTEVERQALLHALEVSSNNVTRAARSLGIDRATLYRKLKKYGLPARR